MILSYLLVIIAVVAAISLWRMNGTAKRGSIVSPEELVRRLKPVNRAGIPQLALDHLQPGTRSLPRSPAETYDLIGGSTGLASMESNIAILLALVHYIHRCDPSHSTEVAHQMERDALALRRALIALGLNMLGMKSAVNGPACVNEAASSYYLMKERVLALYKRSNAAAYPALRDVL
jgi:hypothetical protein